MLTLKILFWAMLLIVFYTYIGYGILLYIIIRLKRFFRGKPREAVLPPDEELPDMTLLICAYNEEDVVAEKMKNTLAIDYPKDKFRIMWVTDGSNDHTNELLKAYPEVDIVFSPERRGKSAALKHGLRELKTRYVAFTDANTMLNPGAMKEIARQFMDPSVGCVSGEKRVMAKKDGDMAAEGEGLYWRYESTLKRWDSELYSTMGAAGELYAIDPTLVREVPDEALLDDFMMSMYVVEAGKRIAYAPDAYAQEYGSANIFEESKRKRRIAAGGLQSIWWLRRMLNPMRQPLVTFQYVSHRVLRWSVTPVAMIILLIVNGLLSIMGAGLFYDIILILQILFYAMALIGWLSSRYGHKNKMLYTIYYFVFMNINVFRGMAYLRTHGKSGAWEKAKRS
ncbi:Glycosyltransferase, catalytic subunit of cellulose synthase and poly-beta-1,6-N-acetylglucosamine synthase [Prevotella sp. ne3005]|uniref:glycosyltransferase family 2 protein n=1 Tax=Prevotella sp. ne3005 TaxID=1761887 RepID=UPI0008BA3497|nr:glycosyltransferase family 2 protein [Prevotella sp. ne3005]SEM92925.1 Glycosyltransferase, catalytic subunit of cellulose synthase and poly-beta-1,6-N-acetylglucosamine synthase [Prevotella sp. ne3005]